MTPVPAPRVLTAAALAAQLGMTRRWVYAQVEEHRLPAIRLGRTLLFDPAAVEAWLQQHRVGDWPKPCADADPDAGMPSMLEEVQIG